MNKPEEVYTDIKNIWFFGFLCGITFSLLIGTLAKLFSGNVNKKDL